MLTIYKTEHSKRIGVIKNTADALDSGFIYLVEKIRGQISQDDIDGILATYMIFNSTNKVITEAHYEMAINKARKQKVDYEQIKSLDMNYHLKNEASYFTICPYDEKYSDRDTIFCSGSAGSGKTWFANEYTKMYQVLHKKNSIYYLSVHKAENDNSISVKGLKEVDASQITKPVKKDEIGAGLIIMDDVDSEITIESDSDDEETISKSKAAKQKNRKVLMKYAKENVLASAKNIVSNSRKYKTSIIFISHKLKELATHNISVGTNWLVCFPYVDYNQIASFFETRTNITGKAINSLINSSERMKYEALIVNKESNLYMYQNKIGIL